MFSSEDHPGLFTIMIGVAALVFTGVGLSVLMDKQAASGGKALIMKEIRQGEQEIAQMKELRIAQERHVAELEKKVTAANAAYPAAKAAVATQEARLEALHETLDARRKEVVALEREFDGYQSARRKEARAAAVGLALNALRTKSGKVYTQVVLRRVTLGGLEITHSQGAAAIPATDLEKPFHDKFQWTETELAAVEKYGMAAPSSAVTVAQPPADSGPAPEEIAKARSAVVTKRSQVSVLMTQLAEAEAGKATGKTSVPGSLDTWDARVSRCRTALARARAELSVLQARLAEVSPRDPLSEELPE